MASVMTCKVHPVVVFSIVDAYERRSSKPGSEDKAVGTLMGYYERGAIQVTNCYSVPFNEKNGELLFDQGFNDHMQDMMQRAVSTETPVGWFCTNPVLSDTCMMYHDYYAQFVDKCLGVKEVHPVVLLTLDTTLQGGHMGLRAYLRTTSGIPGKANPHCAIFNPIKVETESFPAEQVALDLVTRGTEKKKREVALSGGVEQLTKTSDQMVEWIDTIRGYVDDVLAGKREADSNVGRRLMELVNSVNRVSPQQYDSVLNSGMRDYLMISYLSQLAKTQLSLYENIISIN